MISRRWHGVVPAHKADAYAAYLLQTGISDYKATPGNLGVFMSRRVEGDVVHFETISLWESLAAIRSFAGDDIEAAKYYPEDSGFLLELEPKVVHHEVLMSYFAV